MAKPSKPNAPGARFDSLFTRRPFQIAFGVVCLGLAYVFVSWAIDSGSLLDYAITLLLLFLGIRELTVVILGRKRGY